MYEKSKSPKCDFPGCKEEGLHRAPKDRNLKEYYSFCQKHAAEYNKSWNYCDGMSADEIECEIRADEIWRSQTFRFGLNLGQMLKDGHIDDPLGLFEGLMGHAAPAAGKPALAPALTPAQREALKTLCLEYPFTASTLKSAYKKQVKIHHPDLNAGSKESEERFKSAVAAYNLLKQSL
ncbi:MAG: DnaJ domain-containing protein [Rickettsiales bacterium]|jgi:hypothetical protein|nr:DnaJ domain-containing protein [Rickettsiales bacterium]